MDRVAFGHEGPSREDRVGDRLAARPRRFDARPEQAVPGHAEAARGIEEAGHTEWSRHARKAPAMCMREADAEICEAVATAEREQEAT
jgi:hypothetical protein